MTSPKPRLKADDWILAGFRALADKGPHALKAEPLAREMSSSKGSFYWHFKDVSDFHARMLASWQDSTIQELTREIAQENNPRKQLHILGDLVSGSGSAHDRIKPESAIRAWAQSNHAAASAVKQVDEHRLEQLASILSHLDLTNPDFVRIVYSTYVGLGTLPTAHRAQTRDTISTLLAALLALRDA